MEIGRVNRKSIINQERKIISEKKIFLKVLIRQEIENLKNN